MMDNKTTIQEIATVVEEAIKYHDIFKGENTLGNTFHEAGRELGLIKGALELFPAENPNTQPSTEAADTPSSTEAIDTPPSTDTAQDQSSADALLKDSLNDAKLLRDLFQKISQAPPSMMLKVYKNSLKEKNGDNLVETLVLNLMQNLCGLAKDYEIEEKVLKKLRDAIKKLKNMKSSKPNVQTQGIHSFLNNGDGTQFNSTTDGTQNNSTGSGPSLFGSIFHGGVSFGVKI